MTRAAFACAVFALLCAVPDGRPARADDSGPDIRTLRRGTKESAGLILPHQARKRMEHAEQGRERPDIPPHRRPRPAQEIHHPGRQPARTPAASSRMRDVCADANADGLLDGKEREAWDRIGGPQRDADSDGKLSPAEQAAGPRRADSNG